MPGDLTALDDIRFVVGKTLVVVSCTEADFAAFVEDEDVVHDPAVRSGIAKVLRSETTFDEVRRTLTDAR